MGYINSVLSNPAFQVFLIAMIGYIIGRIVLVNLFCNTLFDKYLLVTSLHWC